uniref:BTB domain-containing protein n=1 Tax=Caenorhabditis tropicalis TaxID=1561998 RepID=A0A1I7THU2_9PELO
MTSSEDVITLNVGGTMYTTTRSTLSKETDTLLANIATGSLLDDERVNVVTMPDGTLFVDRDGPLFAYILHFLRTDKLSLPEQFRELARLKDEADFYRLERFSALLSASSSISPRPRTANGYTTPGAETGTSVCFSFHWDTNAPFRRRFLSG